VSVDLRAFITRVINLFNGAKATSRAATALLYAGSAAFNALIAFLALAEMACYAARFIEALEGL